MFLAILKSVFFSRLTLTRPTTYSILLSHTYSSGYL